MNDNKHPHFITNSSIYGLETNQPHNHTAIPLEDDGYAPAPMEEQSLWRSVIIQATLDAACAPLTSQARRNKTKAIMWLSMQDKDFLMVCELAGLEPLATIRGAKKYIKQSTVIHKRKFYMKRLRTHRFQEAAIKTSLGLDNKLSKNLPTN